MFNEQTTFILGAGCSYGYGYPLGDQLKKQIIELISNDNIVFHLPLKAPTSDMFSFMDHCIDLNKIYYIKSSNYSLEKLGYEFEPSIKPYGIFHMRGQKSENNPICSLKLSKIKEFKEICEELETNHYLSIDQLVNERSGLESAAKVLIYFLIREKEKPDYKINNGSRTHPFFTLDTTNEEGATKHNFHGKHEDKWYEHLFQDIFSNCNNFEDVLNNKLNIISFNYDISLEYFLIKRLSNPSNRLYATYEQLFQFISNKIHHVYGSVYNIKDQNCISSLIRDYGKHYLYGEEKYNKENIADLPKTSILMMDAIAETFSSDNGINTIRYNHFDSNKKIQEIVQNSKTINVLGYGFDTHNNRVVGIPRKGRSTFNNYSNFSDYKSVRNIFDKCKGHESNKKSMSEIYLDICRSFS